MANFNVVASVSQLSVFEHRTILSVESLFSVWLGINHKQTKIAQFFGVHNNHCVIRPRSSVHTLADRVKAQSS